MIYINKQITIMITRSQSKQPPLYSVEIDFDEASAAWKSNKISQGNGTYTYCCIAISKTGKKCCQKIYKTTDYCARHYSNNITSK